MVKKIDTVTNHTFALNEEDVLTIIDALYEYGDDALADELSGLIEEDCKCDDVKYEETPRRIDSLEAFDMLMRDMLEEKR